MIKDAILEFLSILRKEEIEVYNEFSLQHELGIFLRTKFPDYIVQFERNTKFFNINSHIKHEIDIVIYNEYGEHPKVCVNLQTDVR